MPATCALPRVRRAFPPVDRAVLAEIGPPPASVAFVKESMRQGTDGCLADYRIFGDPWGFDLDEIHLPVDIWEGSEDKTGPSTYRDFLARHLPGRGVRRAG